MKRIFCFLIIAIILTGSCCAEHIKNENGINGIFVPDISSFMDLLTNELNTISSEAAEELIKYGKYTGKWDVYFYTEYKLSDGSNVRISISNVNDFMYNVSLSIYGIDSLDSLDQFKETMRIIISAANPGISDSELDTFFSELNFDKITTSEVEYLSQQYNFGLYQYFFRKQFENAFELEIQLF